MKKRSLIPILYILFLLLPIYWLVAMSFKTTNEILSGFSLFPQTFTLENYAVIFTDPSWYWGYINSILYVSLNTVISIAVALAHCLFNIPLAVWILEGFMRGVPKELDETAYVDGYSFPRFFVTIFLPSIKAGVGVAAFFCFMFSWVEMLLAKTLTAVDAKPIAATMTKTASSAGYELGLLAAAGTLTIIPGAVVIYFVRNYIAKGFALGRV
jgi:glycerol transport system permease protein